MESFMDEIKSEIKDLFLFSDFSSELISLHNSHRNVLWCIMRHKDVLLGIMSNGRIIPETWSVLSDYGKNFLVELIKKDFDIDTERAKMVINQPFLAKNLKEQYVQMLDIRIAAELEKNGVDFNNINAILVYDYMLDKIEIQRL